MTGSPVQTPPPTPSAAPAPRTCPRCGATLTPEQEWCLTCGADVGARIARTPAWRGPLVIASVVLGLIAVAAVIVFLELADGGEPVAQAPEPTPAAPVPTPVPPATTPAPDPGAAPTPAPAPGTEPTPTPAPGGDTAPTPTPTPDAGSPPAGEEAVPEWPAGETAWTVIVRSTTSRSAAERAATQQIDAGRDAGILDSDDFSSLRPGYWVAWVGQFESQSRARSQAEEIGGEAYPRRVSPD